MQGGCKYYVLLVAYGKGAVRYGWYVFLVTYGKVKIGTHAMSLVFLMIKSRCINGMSFLFFMICFKEGKNGMYFLLLMIQLR